MAQYDRELHCMDAPGVCPADGICLIGLDTEASAGDVDTPFTMMSAVKPFLLLRILELWGADEVWRRVGREPSALPYYSLEQLQLDGGRPRNAMINSGAMVLSSLLPGHDPAARAEGFRQWLGSLTPAAFDLDQDCLADVLTPDADPSNRALITELEQAAAIPTSQGVFETYFRLCCLRASARQVASLAQVLARRAEDPNVAAVLHTMSIAGLYEATPAWTERARWPAKSAVSGMMFVVVPGIAGLAACSPWLDSGGNPILPRIALALACDDLALGR